MNGGSKAIVDWFANELASAAEKGHYRITCIVLFLMFVAPGIWALWTRIFLLRKIERLYKERIDDKDKEINRMAETIKRLENKLLNKKRT